MPLTQTMLFFGVLLVGQLFISPTICRGSPNQQQSGISASDTIKTLVTKLASTQTEADREALLSENDKLLMPDLNQLFVDRGRESFKQQKLFDAVNNFEIAKSIAAKINDRLRLAQALTTLGNLYRLVGNNEIALQRLRQALPLHEALGNTQGTFFTLLNIVIIEIYENKYDETNLQRLMTRAAESKHDEWIALSLSQLGSMQFLKGAYGLAMESHRRSLVLYERTGAQEGIAFALHALGVLERVYGNYDLALEYFEESQRLNEELKRPDLYSRTLSSIGEIYKLLGDETKALDYYQRSISAGEIFGSKFWMIFSLAGLGEVYRTRGQFPEALVQFEAALKLSEKLGFKDRIAYSCLLISDIHYLQSDYFKAAELAERALAIAQETGSRDAQWKAMTAAAKAYNAMNQKEKAQQLLLEATNTIDDLRSAVVGRDFRSTYFATVQQPYEIYIDILMQQHKLNNHVNAQGLALELNERRIARSLLEMLSRGHTDIRKGVNPRLLERERTLQQELNLRASRLIRVSSTSQEGVNLRKEIEALTADYQRLEAEIRQSSPAYAALTQPPTLTVRQIQLQLLDGETALLEYSLGEQRSYVWMVSATSISSFELPGRSQIEASIQSVIKLLNDGTRWATNDRIKSEYESRASKLSGILFPSALVSELKARRLLIVSDGALQYLPFGALPSPANQKREGIGFLRPLIADYEIVSLPSASTLAALRKQSVIGPNGRKSIAVLADPVFDQNDERVKSSGAKNDLERGAKSSSNARDIELSHSSALLERSLRFDPNSDAALRITRLPFTRFEAEGILAAAPPDQSLKATDFRANRETATSAELAQFRFVHFATHAILNSEHPELSGIVLSLVDEQGKAVDGFLRLHDIYNLHLPAELVVLSACQTGLGKEIRGEGLVGLTRGFMYAGTPRVVASLWKVDDAATAELMKRFYAAMLKDNLRPAAALRRAKVEMWKQKRWQAPFYWAAFELQGEWQ